MTAKMMSEFYISTTVEKTIDGISYNADIAKWIHLDFSAAEYTISVSEDKDNEELQIEFIPDSEDFLHEVTDIFPLSEYDIRITGTRYKRFTETAFYLNIYEKETGELVWFCDESVTLSDKDYNYLRDIILKEIPDYDCMPSVPEYLKNRIAQYMCDWNFGLAAGAEDLLIKIVSDRYDEAKIDGMVDFDCHAVDDIARNIIADAVRNVYFKVYGDAGSTRL